MVTNVEWRKYKNCARHDINLCFVKLELKVARELIEKTKEYVVIATNQLNISINPYYAAKKKNLL